MAGTTSFVGVGVAVDGCFSISCAGAEGYLEPRVVAGGSEIK